MEMHQVRYFLTVCDTRNFTRAAQRCNVAQPSLTRAIKKLEDELGGSLFRRERAATHLTELGRLMRPHLENIHLATHAARSDATSYSELELAPLRIGIMNSLAPSRFIGFFQDLKAEISTLDLSLAVAPAAEIIEVMTRGDIDMAFMAPIALPERFLVKPVFEEPYAIACPRDHRFNRGGAITLAALSEESCLLPRHFAETALADLIPMGRCSGHDDSGWVQAAALRENRCALIPQSSAPLAGVEVRPIAAPAPTFPIGLVTHAGRQHTPSAARALKRAVSHSWRPVNDTDAPVGPALQVSMAA